MSRLANVVVAAVLVVPSPAWALYHSGGPGRSEYAPGQQRAAAAEATPSPVASPGVGTPDFSTPRGKLREAQHAERLARFQGVVLGMTNKLANLSQRLARHLESFTRRIEALRAAGFDITVDKELSAVQGKVGEAQTLITDIVNAIQAIPDSETPRVRAREVRGQVRRLRGEISEVRAAFRRLRLAVRDDVRRTPASPSPSPVVTPTLTPSPSPSPSP